MITISNNVHIPDTEIEFIAVRAEGAGGQNVNKVSSAIHLRFNIRQSSLPDFHKDRLLQLSDHRITNDGIIIIKAQKYRTQQRNKDDAIKRLKDMILTAIAPVKKRKPTKATRASQQKRMDKKKQRGTTKSLRGKVNF